MIIQSIRLISGEIFFEHRGKARMAPHDTVLVVGRHITPGYAIWLLRANSATIETAVEDTFEDEKDDHV